MRASEDSNSQDRKQPDFYRDYQPEPAVRRDVGKHRERPKTVENEQPAETPER